MTSKTMDNVFQASEAPFLTAELLCKELAVLNPGCFEEGEHFRQAAAQLGKDISFFQNQIENMPIISLVVLWIKAVATLPFCGVRKINLMAELLKSVLALKRNEKLLRLREFPSHEIVLNAIRCHAAWFVEQKEDIVQLYIEFSQWLSKHTYGFIKAAEDKDRLISEHRKISFEKYIQLISNLEPRERLLVKIFYLGKSPTREEIFALKLEDVNFKEQYIIFPTRKVYYPVHVFEDVHYLVGERKNGFLFSSKKGERLSFSVPYRKFKRMLEELKMDSSLTFNDLSEDS